MEACSVQIGIACAWRPVCDFLSQPLNHARWASWLGPTLRERGGEWTVRRSAGGLAKVRFCERNAFGVADHWLLDAEDRVTLVGLRALPHGEGSQVVLTLLPEPGCDEAGWPARVAAARRDLQRLRDVLEGRAVSAPSRRGRRSSARIVLTATSQRPSAHKPCMPASS